MGQRRPRSVAVKSRMAGPRVLKKTKSKRNPQGDADPKKADPVQRGNNPSSSTSGIRHDNRAPDSAAVGEQPARSGPEDSADDQMEVELPTGANTSKEQPMASSPPELETSSKDSDDDLFEDEFPPGTHTPREQPTTLSPSESETSSEDSDDDLLEVEAPTSTFEPLFDFDEPPSPTSSAYLSEDEVPSLDLARSQLSDPPLITTPPETPCPKKFLTPLGTTHSFKCILVLEGLLPMRCKKTSKNQSSQPDRLSTKSSRPTNFHSNSQSQPRVNTPNKGPSRMAAGHARSLMSGPRMGAVASQSNTRTTAHSKQGAPADGPAFVMVKLPTWIWRILRVLKIGHSVPSDSVRGM